MYQTNFRLGRRAVYRQLETLGAKILVTFVTYPLSFFKMLCGDLHCLRIFKYYTY